LAADSPLAILLPKLPIDEIPIACLASLRLMSVGALQFGAPVAHW
jgi:hypothetical protein